MTAQGWVKMYSFLFPQSLPEPDLVAAMYERAVEVRAGQLEQVSGLNIMLA